MNAATARATSEVAVAEAELCLQQEIARERARATPEAIAAELLKVPQTAATTRERLNKEIAEQARLGRRELRLFKVCGGEGSRFYLPDHNLVGVAFWKAVGETLRDALVEDGFDVRLRVYQYLLGDGPEPKAHPRTTVYYTGVEVDLRW